MTSLSSEFTLSPEPKTSDFQLRRRRAAKLTHFFGVDYRELVHDVLESIEKGVEEERRRGTLQPEEVQVSIDKSSCSKAHDGCLGVVGTSTKPPNAAILIMIFVLFIL
jgi:hypothetical protein